ncbi:MAG: hypothetical protein A3G32_04375 [Deltaproteobacteria bacterium RIFCSPLOWO2_12_FULL_40_28]|nr:MAG: hypothetical protein A3C45_08485 [Deltaproteobacteria bacterium RIFCSPHIGHO2_02_FULL_40_28]OGQ19607.1 MAG: hypothetical protein A3E27_07680 [Deltaproteobacteria bacterium RIFCSPHIGHO2_12_FULL_40_32]OGQ40884.1 MAG: hypothetical protein A3I69_03095 [Deltaproteobacteria bacterium RIFCSPLOWO2_02_FULL_40_36]OGQ53999.1 MAG: hypothetical protein A3G32_04375 [Deltaproteobacteria bacterium RIFCSPLOWO2_12_FULL_40_28]
MSFKILVSILFYNDVKSVCHLISDFTGEKQKFDLLVMDNGSQLENHETLKKNYPSVTILRQEINLGYTGGNNHVFQWAVKHGYDYVVICNQDIHIENGFMDKLYTILSETNISVLGVVEKDMDTKEIVVVGGLGYNKLRMKSHWLRVLKNMNTNVMRVDYVQGALVVFSQSALKAGLAYDPNIFMYYDEFDLGFLMQKKGIVPFVAPHLCVFHKTHDKHFTLIKGYFLHRNRIYLAKKHLTFFQYFLFCLTFFMEITPKLIVRFMEGRAHYVLACIHGCLDGFGGRMGKGRYVS